LQEEKKMTGLYFEEFQVGQKITTVGRTIAESDIFAFAWLSGDYNQLHTDAEFSKGTPFGQRVAHGLLGLSVASGLIMRTGVLEGTVIGSCYPRHRNVEFLKFLRKINSEIPKGLDLHLILDNYGTHTHPNVKKWLTKRHRFHLHFIPTSSSWVNLVERWFAELTEKRVRRGVFKSVPDLIEAIEDFMRTYNENPKPFVWTKKVDQILEKVNECKAIVDTLH